MFGLPGMHDSKENSSQGLGLIMAIDTTSNAVLTTEKTSTMRLVWTDTRWWAYRKDLTGFRKHDLLLGGRIASIFLHRMM